MYPMKKITVLTVTWFHFAFTFLQAEEPTAMKLFNLMEKSLFHRNQTGG